MRASPRDVSKVRQDQRGNRLRITILVTLVVLVVVASVALVHDVASSADGPTLPPELPSHVAELHDLILAAARSGNLDDLKTIFDLSAARPDLGIGGSSDPVAALKAASSDPDGRELLAALVEILSLPPAALPLGSDLENNLIYVWPYLAERPLDRLTPPEQVDLYRLVTPAKVSEMRDKKRWLWWRLVIGADGSWQMFKKMD